MAGIKITIPVDPLLQLTRAAQVKLAAESKDLLDIMGTMLLGQIQTAYKVKARGGTAEDGISWEPIQARTLLARMRRAGHIKKVKQKAGVKARPQFRIAKSNAENNKAFGQMARQGAIKPLSGGRGSARFRRGSTFQVTSSAKRKRGRKRISPGAGGYEIGVDSGLQINTLQPGKSGTAGPSKVVQGNAVIVGAAMEYSQYFDEDRPIIPDVLPDIWVEELEAEAARFADEIMETVFGRSE